MTRIEKLQEKEVINIKDGMRLGYVTDIEIEVNTGKVINLIVINCCKVLGIFGKEEEHIIPWCNIKKIGDEIILVEIEIEKCK